MTVGPEGSGSLVVKGGAERTQGTVGGGLCDTGDVEEVCRADGHGHAGWRTPTWPCGLVENTSYQGDLALDPRVLSGPSPLTWPLLSFLVCEMKTTVCTTPGRWIELPD